MQGGGLEGAEAVAHVRRRRHPGGGRLVPLAQAVAEAGAAHVGLEDLQGRRVEPGPGLPVGAEVLAQGDRRPRVAEQLAVAVEVLRLQGALQPAAAEVAVAPAGFQGAVGGHHPQGVHHPLLDFRPGLQELHLGRPGVQVPVEEQLDPAQAGVEPGAQRLQAVVGRGLAQAGEVDGDLPARRLAQEGGHGDTLPAADGVVEGDVDGGHGVEPVPGGVAAPPLSVVEEVPQLRRVAELPAGGHGQDQALRHQARHLGADGAVRLAPAAGSVGEVDAHDHALHPARVHGAPAVAELEAGAGGGPGAAPVVLPVRRLVAEGHVEGGQPGDGEVGGGHGCLSPRRAPLPRRGSGGSRPTPAIPGRWAAPPA